MSEKPNVLEVSEVVVTYPDGFEALHGVDLTVNDGEVVALLGASGSGKSSLLRAIAGLEAVTSGTVAMWGKDVTGVPVHQRGCGMVFQDGQLFPHRSVLRNVAYGLEKTGLSKQELRSEVEYWLDIVGLSGYGERSITTLSGGQAQRVALARSLARKTGLLLLDEPLSALDRTLRDDLSVELREILSKAGTGAVYVTHDQDEAFTVADRVAVMVDGRIAQIGTMEELYESTDSTVRDFLQKSPTLHARVIRSSRDEGVRAELLTDLVDLPGVFAPQGAELTLQLKGRAWPVKDADGSDEDAEKSSKRAGQPQSRRDGVAESQKTVS